MTNIHDMNDKNYIVNISYISILCFSYSFYFDLSLLGYPFSWGYLLQKLLFILSTLAIAQSNKRKYHPHKIFAFALIYVIYAVVHTYFVSINYIVASIQIAFIFTSLILFDRAQYLFLSILMLVGTSLGIQYNTNNYNLSPITDVLRLEYLQMYINIQLFICFVYLFGTYPKIKKIKTDLLFTDIGKTTTFLLHEIAKPIARLDLMANAENQKDLEEIKETLSIAQALKNNILSDNMHTPLNLNTVIYSGIEPYQNYIHHYGIKLNIMIDRDVMIKSTSKYLRLIIDNLIKNAIEATKQLPNSGDRILEIKFESNALFIKNSYLTSVDTNELFEPAKTSKPGNMGVGLYLSKFICDNLGWTIKVSKSKENEIKMFTAKINF